MFISKKLCTFITYIHEHKSGFYSENIILLMCISVNLDYLIHKISSPYLQSCTQESSVQIMTMAMATMMTTTTYKSS